MNNVPVRLVRQLRVMICQLVEAEKRTGTTQLTSIDLKHHETSH